MCCDVVTCHEIDRGVCVLMTLVIHDTCVYTCVY